VFSGLMKTFREFKEYLQERDRGLNLRPGLNSGDASGIVRRSKVIQKREDPLSPSSIADRARRLRDSERRAATLAPKPQPQPKPEKPKPTGPVTSAQAIRSGSKEGSGPKSSISTYRDKKDTKGTSVGRYLTFAQHKAAVAKRKAAEAAAKAKEVN
tara:strand:+ start:68 stop:535 length:468 start_codon:yes stop_codon:yes gene_type:complete